MSKTRKKTAKPAQKTSAKGDAAISRTKSSKTKPGSKTALVSAQNASTAPIAKRATPAIVQAPQLVVTGPVMRKKELIELVVSLAGIKKKDAKPVIDAMLGVLGEAMSEGRDLILPPLGRIKIHKEKKLAKKRVMIVKVHQQLAAGQGDDAKSEQD